MKFNFHRQWSESIQHHTHQNENIEWKKNERKKWFWLYSIHNNFCLEGEFWYNHLKHRSNVEGTFKCVTRFPSIYCTYNMCQVWLYATRKLPSFFLSSWKGWKKKYILSFFLKYINIFVRQINDMSFNFYHFLSSTPT